MKRAKRDHIPGYLLSSEAASELKVSEKWLRKLIKRGDIKAVRPGRDIFVPVDQVAAYRKNRRPVGAPKKDRDVE